MNCSDPTEFLVYLKYLANQFSLQQEQKQLEQLICTENMSYLTFIKQCRPSLSEVLNSRAQINYFTPSMRKGFCHFLPNSPFIVSQLCFMKNVYTFLLQAFFSLPKWVRRVIIDFSFRGPFNAFGWSLST